MLKERKPDVKIVAVEPKDSPMLTEGTPGPHQIQGIGPNFVPDVLDRTVVDEIFDVEFDDAIRVARELATERGDPRRHVGGRRGLGRAEIAARPRAPASASS